MFFTFLPPSSLALLSKDWGQWLSVKLWRRACAASFICLCLLFVVAPTNSWASPVDPYEQFNRKVFAFNEFFDRWALKPVAKFYRWSTPRIVDKGVSNFFDNLGEVRNILNAGLQADFQHMAVATGRLVVNSTAGLAGLIDVASGWGLTERDEHFGQTLGVWGVESGPYLVLPFLGGSSLRDTVGIFPDMYMSPLTYLDDESARNWLRVLDVVDVRADILDVESLITGDRYTFLREVFLQKRRSDIANGDLPDDFDSFGDDF